MQIGDSVIVIEAGDLPAAIAPWKVTSYVYVEDVDAVHGRALMLGATELAQPQEKPYEERRGGWMLPAITGGWRRTSIHRSNHGMA
jgi:uncharacterized protein YbjT (DUF2867 family)